MMFGKLDHKISVIEVAELKYSTYPFLSSFLQVSNSLVRRVTIAVPEEITKTHASGIGQIVKNG
ncbi:MAG: hypothetical protein ACJAZF_001720 [Granulosicoccus sp.]|jgi:hypothetical protein